MLYFTDYNICGSHITQQTQASRHFRSPYCLYRNTLQALFGHCLCNNKMARDRHTPTEIEIVHRKKISMYMVKIYIYMIEKDENQNIYKSYRQQSLGCIMFIIHVLYTTCELGNIPLTHTGLSGDVHL